MKITILKTFKVVCFLLLMTGLAACSSGGGSSGDDSADDATFTSTDAQYVGAAVYNGQNTAFADINSQYQAAATDISKALAEKAVDLAKQTSSGNIVVNQVYNCRVAGHTTLTGNFPWQVITPDPPDYVAPPFSFSINGQLKEDVSDPTNNLNDCEVGNGIILDGTIYSDLTMSGDVNGGQAQWSTDGILGINRRGSYGGLVMVADDCRIFFTIHMTWTGSGATTGSASGTICDQSYSFSF